MSTHMRRAFAGITGGFSLVELLIVVAIAAVLAGLALPNYQFMLVNMEIRGISFDLVTQMMFARSEALKRNSTVQIDPVGGDWNKGWQIKFGSDVLREQPPVKRVDVAVSPASTTSIRFSQTGRVSNGALAIQISDAAGKSPEISCVSVGLTGIASSRKGAC